MSETCPVCGWAYLRKEPIPENPSPKYAPDVPGVEYVHRWESIGNGKVEISGCSEYENGKTYAWVPEDVGHYEEHD